MSVFLTAVMVFGDSLSASHGGWVEILDESVHVRNYSQAGLKFTDFTVPDWISCRDTPVIIWLGANDADTSNNRFTAKVVDTLQVLEGRDCEVLLIPPPRWFTTIRLRHIIRREAAYYDNVRVVNMPWPTDHNRLHQTPEMHWEQANYILRILNE